MCDCFLVGLVGKLLKRREILLFQIGVIQKYTFSVSASDLTWLYTLRRWATDTVASALQSSSSVAINVAINSLLRCDLWSRSLLVTCHQLRENHRLEQCLLHGGYLQIFGVVFVPKKMVKCHSILKSRCCF